MKALDHLFSCEKRLALAKQDLRAAAEKLSTAGNLSGLLAPFVEQCRARLKFAGPDDLVIMNHSCDGESAAVTAGQARALLKWWDEGEVTPVADCELQKLRAFHEAAGPLMERERARRTHVMTVAPNSGYEYGGYLTGDRRNLSEGQIDAALAAFDAVGECKREGK